MTHKKLVAFSLLAPAALALLAAAYANGAKGDKLVPYKLLTTITIPGNLQGFDISWVDSGSGHYYVADRGSTTTTPPVAPAIDVIDTQHVKYLYSIPLPVASAPNGVVAIHRRDDDGHADADRDQPGQLVVGGLNSTAIFIDLSSPLSPPLYVSTGGNHRADELAYDPLDYLILIANDQDTPAPFISFITTTGTPHVVGKIVYDGTLGNPQSTGGIEQTVWDGRTKKFYISIPSTVAHPKGEVDEIDPKTQKIIRVMPTSCGPAGLALIPGQHLMTSCGDVLDIASGAVVSTTAGVSGDEIWYNPGDERVYFGGGSDRISVPVVSGLNPFSLITTLVAGVINTAPTPSDTTHSVAADSVTNRIFIPVSHEGVKVFTDDNDNGQGNNGQGSN
jgi:hypothetical protein